MLSKMQRALSPLASQEEGSNKPIEHDQNTNINNIPKALQRACNVTTITGRENECVSVLVGFF